MGLSCYRESNSEHVLAAASAPYFDHVVLMPQQCSQDEDTLYESHRPLTEEL